jgi:hypothetical protein
MAVKLTTLTHKIAIQLRLVARSYAVCSSRSRRPVRKLLDTFPYKRWAMGWMIEVLVFDSQRGLGIFLFTTASRTVLGPTELPIQWVPGALSLGVKRPGCEADHSPPSSAEVKNAWSCTSTPQYASMAWCLVKTQGQLYLIPFILDN